MDMHTKQKAGQDQHNQQSTDTATTGMASASVDMYYGKMIQGLPDRDAPQHEYTDEANLMFHALSDIDLENTMLPSLGHDPLMSPTLLGVSQRTANANQGLLDNFPSWDMEELERMNVLNSNSSSQRKIFLQSSGHSKQPTMISVKDEPHATGEEQQQVQQHPSVKQRILASFNETGKRMKSAGLEQETSTAAPGVKRKVTPVGARMSGAGGFFRLHLHDKDTTPFGTTKGASTNQLTSSITDPNNYNAKSEPILEEVAAAEIRNAAASYSGPGENDSLIAGIHEFGISGHNAATTPDSSSLGDLRYRDDRSEDETNPAARRRHRMYVRFVQRMKHGKVSARAFSEPVKQKSISAAEPASANLASTSPSHALSHSGSKHKVVDAEKEKFRLLRNREAAMRSRQEKKEQMVNLEMENEFLKTDVALLKEENTSLKAELEALRGAFNLDGGGLGSVGVGSGALNMRTMDTRLNNNEKD
eukprot:CAMPEP_0184693874 /NCGR_PEP_ID=MMETSP0313-20130426/1996_1 /TAXON_ID=2792 /ORGANISM="Porphyridium aerugineum, Strain SAG 1380-2" /LENGTH=475 /DNA_ID=CAMNT_0027152049 /DNA_START=309 /DNA_END=1736 /DNA_ORIENTATION=+